MQADQYLGPKQGTSLTLLVHYLFFLTKFFDFWIKK